MQRAGVGMRRGQRRAARAIVACAVLSLAAACTKTPEPDASGAAKPQGAPGVETGKPPAAASAAAAASGAEGTTARGSASAGAVTSNEISWEVPAAWKPSPNKSPMRIATYIAPRAGRDPDDAEITVSRAGGTIDMNIARWAEQFERDPSAAERRERAVGSLKVTIVELEGRYSGMPIPGMPQGTARAGYSLLAAIVEGAGTPYFFKMVGPTKTVKAARAGFDQLVDSVRPK